MSPRLAVITHCEPKGGSIITLSPSCPEETEVPAADILSIDTLVSGRGGIPAPAGLPAGRPPCPPFGHVAERPVPHALYFYVKLPPNILKT